jgi:hypothetical protein
VAEHPRTSDGNTTLLSPFSVQAHESLLQAECITFHQLLQISIRRATGSVVEENMKELFQVFISAFEFSSTLESGEEVSTVYP